MLTLFGSGATILPSDATILSHATILSDTTILSDATILSAATVLSSDATMLLYTLLLLPKSFTFGHSGEGARDPCLPVGYSRDAPAGTVVGSGNFEECRAIAKGLIAGQCQDELCPIGDSMPVELQGTACLAAGQKRKDYIFRHQFNEKPSIIPGCPGLLLTTQSSVFVQRCSCHGALN